MQSKTLYTTFYSGDHAFRITQQADEQFKIAEEYEQKGEASKAFEAFTYAALQNHPIAILRLGQLYLAGAGTQADPEMAVGYFKDAAKLNVPQAILALGLCLFRGIGIETNTTEALKLFLSLPKKDCTADILLRIADSYEDGIHGLEQNYQKALEYVELSAALGNLAAQKARMYMYLKGIGCKQDFEKALKYSENLKDLDDDPDLMTFFGTLYERGSDSRKPDIQKALRCYQSATAKGNAIAAYSLASLYYENSKLKNLPEAIKYFQISAEQGYVHSQYFWGYLLWEGKSVNQNLPEAIKYFTLAAKDDHSDALCMLGNCYAEGIGVEIDLMKAFEYYKKVEETQPTAQLALGYYYLEGKIVPKDLKLAFEYFKKAATKDLAVTKQVYGLCLCNGIGCNPDLKKGKELLERAEKLAIKDENSIKQGFIKGYLNLSAMKLKIQADKDSAKGRDSLALAHYERAAELSENITFKKDILLNVAALQMKIEDYAGALNTYERIMKIMPNLNEVLRKQIVCLGLQNEDKTACFYIEKHPKILLSFVKESQEPWAVRISALYDERQKKKAEKKIEMKKAIQLRREKKAKFAKIQENLALETEVLPSPPAVTVPQIAVFQQEMPAYPKVKIPKQIHKAFFDIKQRTGAKSLFLIGTTALELIFSTIFDGESAGIKDPKNWNFYTTDPVENLTLIQGQFPQTMNPKLYDDNGEIIYEKPINLYCDQIENLGLFSIHQLVLDSEGNISGPESALQDLKNKTLRFMRPEEVDQTIRDTFLAKFKGSEFKLLKEQIALLGYPENNSPVTQFGIFALVPTCAEKPTLINPQKRRVLVVSSKIHHTLRFLATADSISRLACIKKDIGKQLGIILAESGVDYVSQCKTQTEGSLNRVEFFYKFENQVDMEKVKELVNTMGLPCWDESVQAVTGMRLG